MHCNMQDKSFCCSFSGLQLEFDQLSGEDGHARGLHHFFHDGAHCGGAPRVTAMGLRPITVRMKNPSDSY
jgi:hypothetical protein